MQDPTGFTKFLFGLDAAALSKSLRLTAPSINLKALLGDDPSKIARALAGPGFDLRWAEQIKIPTNLWRIAPGLSQSFLAPMTSMFEAWAREDMRFGRVERAGWLPHYTTPDLADQLSDDEVRRVLSAHYRDNWSDVRAQLAQTCASFEIDDEAKEVYREALAAHDAGLFRCVPRLLFPEIERVVRDEFFPGELDPLSSQRELRDAAGGLSVVEIRRGNAAGLRLYEKLNQHLYTHVKTEEALAKVSADPVPNRHASLHGLVIYRSAQSSLNALLMTEFAFAIVSTLKRNIREDAAVAAA